MEDISKSENLVPFKGIINNIFECCLKEECEKQHENIDSKNFHDIMIKTNWILLLSNPGLNMELYTKVYNYVKDSIENNNILQLFKEMVEKHDTLMRKEYFYQGKEKEEIYCFTPTFIFRYGKYYLFNSWESDEKYDFIYLPLVSINGVPVPEIFSKFKKAGLNKEQALIAMTGVGLFKYIGLPDDEMYFEVEYNNEIIKLPVSNYSGFSFDPNIFKKGGSIVHEMYDLKPQSYERSTDEAIDNYSYSIFQKCLMILNGICSNNYDRSVVQNLFATTDLDSYVVSDNYFNAMIMIIYFMNTLEEVLKIVPDDIKKGIALNFLDTIYKDSKNNYFINENNESVVMYPLQIVNSPHFDAGKFLKSIKNCFAHFLYSLDNEYINAREINVLGVYQNIQIPMNLNIFFSSFNQILSGLDLSNLFPIVFEDRNPLPYGVTPSPLSSIEQVSSYLDILMLSNNEEVKCNDRELNSIDTQLLANNYDDIERVHYLSEYNEKDKSLSSHTFFYDMKFDIAPLSNDLKEYVLEKVSQYDEFFKKDLFEQRNYIKDLIRYKVSKEKVPNDIIFDFINTKDKATGNIYYLLESYSPLQKEKVIRLIIKTILNTLYLITNGKFEDYDDYYVNYENMGFLSGIDITFEKTKIENKLKQLKVQYSNIDKEIEKLKEKIETQKNQINNPKVPNHVKEKFVKAIEEFEQAITELPNAKKEVEDEIVENSSMLESMNNNSYVMHPHDVIRHIRNAISHNNIEVIDINTDNIMNTKIIVNDFDEKDGGKQTFHCETTFEDLLEYINNSEFLKSIFKKSGKQK